MNVILGLLEIYWYFLSKSHSYIKYTNGNFLVRACNFYFYFILKMKVVVYTIVNSSNFCLFIEIHKSHYRKEKLYILKRNLFIHQNFVFIEIQKAHLKQTLLAIL